MNIRFLRISLVILTVFSYSPAFPCTTFVLRQGNSIVFGRNLDWVSGTGLVIVNPRNLAKVALVDSSQRPMRWVSKFGSVTFNQIGRDLPFGGMNETGLVVEHMTLDQTEYPARDSRYAIGAFQWIQFQLDNYSTVDEVISSDTLLRIEDSGSRIHFLVSDRFGNAAVIEFLGGKMVYHEGPTLPVAALANSTYDESIECYNSHSNTSMNPSLEHFCTAAGGTAHPVISTNDSTIDYAFQLLRSVSQSLATKWSIVYDVSSMRVYFKVFETPTIVGEKKIFFKQPPYDPATKIVNLKDLDFGCSEGAKVFDLNDERDKDVDAYFVNYTTDINKEFITKAFTFYKGWGLNIELKPGELDYLAKYPESFKCVTGN